MIGTWCTIADNLVLVDLCIGVVFLLFYEKGNKRCLVLLNKVQQLTGFLKIGMPKIFSITAPNFF